MQTVNYSDYIYYSGTTQPVVRVDVYVYDANTTNLATLYDSTGASLANPIQTDDDGLFDFWTTYGKYDLFVHNEKQYSVSLLNLAYFYLGAYASAPTQRPDGSSLQAGDMYFDSSLLLSRIYYLGSWYTGSAGDAALIVYDPSGAGAVSTFVQTELRKTFRTSDYDTFQHAIAAATGHELIVDSTVSVSASFSISTYGYVGLNVVTGGLITIATGQTLTIDVPFSCGLFQCFNCVGTGAVTFGSGSVIEVYPEWWGAVADGTTNSTVAAQYAINSLVSGGVVLFSSGQYRIARNTGTNDRWGLKVPQSGITLRGNNASLRRYNTDISTYALAYPIVFVGTPDSNVASATENCTIECLSFIGENTQHNVSGSAPNDFRDAIYAKNTKHLVVKNNTFTAIDSAVITFQKPVVYDYVNAVYYNTTKNYNAKFLNNTCLATSHAVVGRALIHAITALGIDNLLVEGNYFEWCDDAISTDTTYDLETDENDTFITSASGWTLGQVKRSGCGVVVNGNVFENCSEHPIYVGGFNEVVSNNKINSTELAITATNDPIKVRSYGCSVTGNTISGYAVGISCATGCLNVNVSGNTIYVPSTSDLGLGAIGIYTVGLSAYVAARISAGYWSVYRPATGITFSGNSIQFATDAVSPANTRRQMGFSIYCDNTDVNYPQGQIQGISITGNTVVNHQVGLHVTGTLYRNAVVSGNSFFAKPFTESAFSGSTTMNTRAVIQTYRDSTDQLSNLRFDNNSVYGCEYLCASYDAGGSAGTLQMPWGFSNNKLDFVKNIATTDFIGVATTTRFLGNSGVWFLDRTWGGSGVNNSLYSDGASTGNTALRYSFLYSTGTGKMRFYTDDSGTFVSF